MGCWNATCFMSNLPIMAGDKVAFFVLGPTYPEDNIDSRCNPDDRYTPLGTPFIGEYDDYGCVENIEPNEYTEKYLKEVIGKHKIYQKCDDEFKDYEWENVEEFLRAVSHQDLYAADIMRKTKQRLSHVMIHYDLYLSLMKNVANRVPAREKKMYVDLLNREVIKTLEWLDLKKRQSEELKSEIGYSFPCFDRFSDKITIGSSSNRWPCMDAFAKYYVETKDVDIVHHICDYIMWMKVMNLSRKGYHCHSGAGSQDRELMIHKIIAEYIIVKCTEEEIKAEEDGYPYNILEEPIYFWHE